MQQRLALDRLGIWSCVVSHTLKFLDSAGRSVIQESATVVDSRENQTTTFVVVPASGDVVCNRQQLLLFVHKFIHHPELLPEIFINHKLFTFNDEIHRIKSNIHLYLFLQDLDQ